MSSRHFRKVYGGNELPPPEGESDEEFEPHYVKNSSAGFAFKGVSNLLFIELQAVLNTKG